MGIGSDLWTQVAKLADNQDLTGAGSMFTTDAVYIGPNVHLEGSEAIGAYFADSGKGRSDITTETSLVVEDGEVFVAEWTSRSTNTGPLTMPDGTEIPATGKTLEIPGVTVGSIKDGKFASMREYYDVADIARQLGLMPG